jgi:phage-related protein
MDELKPIIWVGNSKKELQAFPRAVQRDIGQALFTAQAGDVDPAAKPLKGFKGATVMEIVESHHSDAYRAVYTIEFEGFVFVLHAFQKKSKSGVKTPKTVIDLIKRRLAGAKLIWQELINE